jgi:hypothetical protein
VSKLSWRRKRHNPPEMSLDRKPPTLIASGFTQKWPADRFCPECASGGMGCENLA